MRISLFGGVRVIDTEGEDIDIGSAKCRAVLATLALSAGTPVTVGRIAGGVWGDDPPAKAEGTLQSYISRLRTALGRHGASIRRVGEAYVLEVDPLTVDVIRFERALDGGENEAALDEWIAPPLAGLNAPGLDSAVASLMERWQSAMHARLENLIDEGRPQETIGPLTELTAEFPFREGWWALLMIALYQDGRQADALAAFAEARRCLVEELGVEPGARLRELEAAILRQDPSIGVRQRVIEGVESSGQSAVQGVPGNLTKKATSFVGREGELAQLCELMGAHRLVTLTGVGGVGKTRLAVQAAAELADGFVEGVWLVELAAISDPTAVPDAVATVLGVTAAAEMTVTDAIAEALAGQRMLLVLDNCEHLLDATADLIDAFLARTETVNVMATSREALRLGAEHVWSVSSLDVEAGAASAAVELFVDRAQAASAEFALRDENETAAVIEICQRLDGIALAIELAAARMVSMSAQEVRDRLGDRFRFLSGSSRGVERHQTLYSAVSWSYDLLDDDERSMLDRCSVFADGFDLAAATHINGGAADEYEVLDLLDSLVRKSLITTERISGRTRYAMLETIRQFGEDQLASTDAVAETRDRHARYFADQVIAQLAIWNGPELRDATDWVNAEFGNLRVGFRWATDIQDLVTAAAIAAHTTMISFHMARYEPIGWVEEVLATATDVAHLPRLHTTAALCMYTGRTEEAVAHAEIALALEANPAYDPFEPGWSSFFHALAILRNAGQIERFLNMCKEMATKQGLERVLGLCGMLYGMPVAGRADEAIAIADTTLAAARDHGHRWLVGFAMRGMGSAYGDTHPARALAMLDQAIEFSREHRLAVEVANATRNAAAIEARHGDTARALAMFDTALESFQRARNQGSLATTIADLTVLFEGIEHYEIAATLHGIHAGHGHGIGLPEALVHIRSELGEPTFDRLVAQGEAMGFGDAMHYARSQVQSALHQLASQTL